MRSIRMLGLILPGTVALAGCGGEVDDRGFGPGNPGSFSANVTGDLTADLSGSASFAVFDDGTTEMFEVVLRAGPFDSNTHLITFTREGRRPEIHTYPIGIAPGYMSGTLYDAATSTTFTLVSGSVRITSSRENGVSGTLAVTGEDASGNAISITGSFSSECISDDDMNLTCS